MFLSCSLTLQNFNVIEELLWKLIKTQNESTENNKLYESGENLEKKEENTTKKNKIYFSS